MATASAGGRSTGLRSTTPSKIAWIQTDTSVPERLHHHAMWSTNLLVGAFRYAAKLDLVPKQIDNDYYSYLVVIATRNQISLNFKH